MQCRIPIMFAMALAAPLAHAEADPRPHYISDDVTVSLREQADTEASTNGTVSSGDRVTVVQSQGAGSFARVRTADGREGWIPERYLTETPAARDRLDGVQRQLEEAQAQLQSLKAELDTAHQQLAQVKPSLDLASQNDQLKAKLEASQHELSSFRTRDDAEFERRQTLLYGGALLGVGLLLGLLLPWFTRPKRRRYSDF